MIKAKKITTDKATLLVVELPEGANNVRVNNARGIFGYTDKINIVRWEALEFGNWQLLGRLPDITEEQALKVVEKSKQYSDLYKSYNADDIRPYSYAIESLSSLIQANEVYFENPLGDKYIPENCILPEYRQEWTMNQYDTECIKARDSHYLKWLEAQSKVWDKERCYLFIKED